METEMKKAELMLSNPNRMGQKVRSLVGRISVGLAATLVGCAEPPQPPRSWEITGPTMGTTYSVTLADPDRAIEGEPVLASLRDEIRETLDSINRQMSTYDAASEISRFNASNSTEPMPVSADFAQVVAKALHVTRESEGRFDITVSPLVELWGFGPGKPREIPPTDDEIAAAQACVGSDGIAVTLNPPTLTKKNPNVRLDVNAIAPGFAADLLSALCEKHGFVNHLVDVGGEFRAEGRNGSGEIWRVGIEKPIRSPIPTESAERVLRIERGAVATSGDYRQFFEHAGTFYSHTIDPTTGRPVTHRLASVTIIAPDALSADAWATAVMVLGPDKGMQLVEKLQDVEALLMIRNDDQSFQEVLSSGMSAYLAE
jgi:thiamine biosynthesis lipoprotein